MMKRLAIVTAMLVLLLLAGCKETLLSRLSEPQANQVVAALGEAGIAASKDQLDETNWSVTVQGEQLGRASALLQSQGLPHAKHVPMGEIFKKDGLIPSSSEERIRFVAGLSEELSLTLRKIPGVVDARVHVVIPHNDPLASKIKQSSASVFVKHLPSADMTKISSNIKDLVAASVEGLEMKNVALFSFPIPESTPVAKAVPTKTAQQDVAPQNGISSVLEAISIAVGGFLLVGAVLSRTSIG